jgi:hypothetical protein
MPSFITSYIESSFVSTFDDYLNFACNIYDDNTV